MNPSSASARSRHRNEDQGRRRRQVDRRDRRQVDRLALRRVRARGGAQDQGGEGRGSSVVSVGPERTKTGLRECLAGEPTRRSGSNDRRSTSTRSARRRPWPRPQGRRRLLWFGQKGVGYDEGPVGRCSPSSWTCRTSRQREARGRRRKDHGAPGDRGRARGRRAPLPAVLTAQKGLNEPRYASLKGIMAAKKKPIAEKKLGAAGLRRTPRPRRASLELPPAAAGGQAGRGRSPAAGQGAAAPAARRSEGPLMP